MRIAVMAAVVILFHTAVAIAEHAPDVAENSIGMKLVKIPGGSFEMGSNDASEAEKPTHPVRITRAFYLGQTEVTQRQWQRVMETTPWKDKGGADVAATYVSWNDAVGFCARLTKLERSSGRLGATARYRLPTEAEWEYACRAGTKTTFSFGDDEGRLGEFAWFSGNANDKKHAHEVGRKKPNPWGLHDMHGNVWEWCSDGFSTNYYAQSPTVDPEGPGPTSAVRVIRGGSWDYDPVSCSSAYRFFGSPDTYDDVIGFRVVCELE